MRHLTPARFIRSSALACSGFIYLAALSACGGGDSAAPVAPVTPPPPAPVVQVAPSVTAQPQAQSVADGQPATFTVNAGGSAPLSYQWSRNGVAIAGATAASYTTPVAGLGDSADVLRVSVRNEAGTVNSDAAALLVSGIGVRTLAGGAADSTLARLDGVGKEARFLTAGAMTQDSAGNLFIADTLHKAVRKVTPGGVVTTLAGSVNASVTLRYPRAIAAGAGGALYVSDAATADDAATALRKIGSDGTVSTVVLPANAGDPRANDGAELAPRYTAVAADAAGNVYIATEVSRDGPDTCSSCVSRAIVRKVAPDGKITLLLSIDGPSDLRNSVTALAVDKSGNVFALDRGNIVKIDSAGTVTTVLRNELGFITALTVDAAGNLYFATEPFSGRASTWPIGAIGKVTPQGAVAVAADPNGTDARFKTPGAQIANPRGIAVDAGAVYVSGSGRVLKLVLP